MDFISFFFISLNLAIFFSLIWLFNKRNTQGYKKKIFTHIVLNIFTGMIISYFGNMKDAGEYEALRVILGLLSVAAIYFSWLCLIRFMFKLKK